MPRFWPAKSPRRQRKIPARSTAILRGQLGDPLYDRTEAAATIQQKAALEKLDAASIQAPDLAGEKILTVLTKAPGDGNAIGGVKVIAQSGWFAARPSGTEDIYKIYAESFKGKDHLARIEQEAQAIVGRALAQKDVSAA